MKTCLLTSAVLVLVLLSPGLARADSIAFAYSGPGLSVSGTLFGVSNGNGSWSITGIDATYNQIQISGIVANGLDPHFIYNNLYYAPGYAAYAVDYYGIVFAVPGLGEVNLCSYAPAGGCGSGDLASILWNGSYYQFTQLTQSNFGPAVPEPATLAMFGTGLVAAGAFARRYLRH